MSNLGFMLNYLIFQLLLPRSYLLLQIEPYRTLLQGAIPDLSCFGHPERFNSVKHWREFKVDQFCEPAKSFRSVCVFSRILNNGALPSNLLGVRSVNTPQLQVRLQGCAQNHIAASAHSEFFQCVGIQVRLYPLQYILVLRNPAV